MTKPKSSRNTILALDQSTSVTGYCVFCNGKKIESGTIKSSFDIDKDNFFERINDMGRQINLLVDRIKPSVVILEDIQFQRNYGVYKRLANLQGVIFTYLFLQDVPFFLIEVTKWKSFLGVTSKGRENQKAETRALVKSIYNIDAEEDEADAIGIGHWAVHNLIITNKE